MQIIVNGEKRECKNDTALLDFLAEAGYRLEQIAVEINGMILKKAGYESCILHSGDILEVVTFVGGG